MQTPSECINLIHPTRLYRPCRSRLLLDDHLRSEGGVEDFYVEKKVLLGEANQRSVTEVERLSQSVMQYKAQQRQANFNVIAGGLMAVNAAVQQGLVQSAIADSGGVMTPQVQMAQLNAQLATMGSQFYAALVTAQASGGQKSLQTSATPWSISTFTQQLVDPKQGVNIPDIMKGFAASVTRAGGNSYQAGARQLVQSVDALQQLRKNPTAGGVETQVKKFADVFNTFLVQVQEIK